MKLNYIAVDDEPIFLKELSEELKTFPFLNEMQLIDDPFEAIDVINKQRPDVIFLDHDMPGMNGKDVLKAINYKTNVVFITSNFSPIQDVINHDGIASIQGYLSKPLNKEEIKDICLKLRPNNENRRLPSRITIPNGKKEDYYIDSSKLSYIISSEKYTDWHFTDSPQLKNISLSMKETIELLRKQGIDFNEMKRGVIIFENGIKMRRNKDIIVISNNKEVEIASTDKDGLFYWIKSIFR